MTTPQLNRESAFETGVGGDPIRGARNMPAPHAGAGALSHHGRSLSSKGKRPMLAHRPFSFSFDS
jgi:hypothetical protein